MSLFQKSVENKYLNELDPAMIDEKYACFQDYFGNPERQGNIRNSKEEQFQEGFLRELFVKVLGYTLNPEPNFNLTTELKNIANSKKADGAILKDNNAIAVIELKSTNTPDLDSIETQAFGYKNHHPKCEYVITSNFEKLRFYIQNAVIHIDFNLFKLTKEQFSLMWLCLAKDNLINDLPLKIKNSSVLREKDITKKLYADYSKFRKAIYNNLVKNNPDTDKLLLFKKTQKLLDRFLFIFFAEDRLLLPPNSISEILKQWTTLKDELDAYVPLYNRFKKYFGYMNTGYKGKKYDIYAYNGGLFAPDKILDSITIDDDILYEHTLNLSKYNFETEVDVNILGHIFEHSLSEIENVQAEIAQEKGNESNNNSGVNPTVKSPSSFVAPTVKSPDSSINTAIKSPSSPVKSTVGSKRKKDGIFYTPKYITKYIVENTVGKLCEEKRIELDIVGEEYAKGRKNRKKTTIKALDKKLDEYRNWLLTLTILDPACGSGAFLNQALEFLIAEHRKIDELRAQLLGGNIVFSDITTDILEKNIFGVDINEESVEIAKLSLWLRTAQKGRKLNTLSNNIKCGNSLIDDPEVAGDKAFNWQKEFPNIFKEKEKKAWHVTFVLHNARHPLNNGITRRIEPGFVANTYPELSIKEQEILADELGKAAKEYSLNILECNVCNDHVHAIIVCEKEELSTLIGKWKGRTAFTYNRRVNPSVTEQFAMYADGTKEKFWARSFHHKPIDDETQMKSTVQYIRNNRKKHKLPPATNGLTHWLAALTCTTQHAYRTEYKGGFDVVIGNPPYVPTEYISANDKSFLEKTYISAFGRINLYPIFYEKGIEIIRGNGILSFITPYTILKNQYYKEARKFILNHSSIEILVDFKEGSVVFEDAAVDSIILVLRKNCNANHTYLQISNIKNFQSQRYTINKLQQNEILKNEDFSFNISINDKLIKKISKNCIPVSKIINFNQGIITGENKKFLSKEKNVLSKKVITGSDFNRYKIAWGENYISYDTEKLHRPRKKEIFDNEEKILLRQTGAFPICMIDNEGFYTLDTVHNGLKINGNYGTKYLLALLNSKLLRFLYENSINETGKVFAQVKIIYIDPLPIKKADDKTQALFNNKAEAIIKQTRSSQAIEIQLVKLLQAKFCIGKPSKKLKNWHELEFAEFLKELNKAKIRLSLPEEAEWMQYFNEQKEKVQTLKSKIEKTDKEIDQMVYELYGLTEAEIAIVENSNK